MARSLVSTGAVCALAWVAALLTALTALTAVPPGELALGTPRGAWLAVLLASLLAVAGLAVLSLAGAPPRSAWQLVVAGAVCGIAWGAALRAFMAMVAGPDSVVSWLGTFGFLLLPTGVVGGLLGYAEHRRRLDLPPRRLTLAPLVLAVDPSALLLVLPAMAGGWALAGRGTRRGRRLAWTAMVVPVTAFLVIVSLVGDLRRLLTLEGVAGTVLLFSCLAVLTIACSIPHRVAPGPRATRFVVGVPG
jgi:hypothetical protein